MSDVEAGTGTCYLWKEMPVFERCGEGEDGSSVRSLRHETNDRTQKPEHNAATLSEPNASRHGRIESGAAVKSLKGLIDVEGGKGICNPWKEKGQCSQGDRCSFRHESHDRAKPTPKAVPSSEPPTLRGGSASRVGSLKGRSQSEKSNRQPCKNFLKGFCTKSPCDCWHPPESQVFVGNKFGAEFSFPHWKVEEQTNKRPKKGGDKSAVAIVESVRQLCCVSQDAELAESVTISRKGTKVLTLIRRVRFELCFVRQKSEKTKVHR